MDSDVSLLVGKTIQSVKDEGGESILFVCDDGDAFEAHHMQDCCETVRVHDIRGELESLVGQTITEAHEDISSEWPSDVPAAEYTDSFTWTTHTFRTATTEVVVRWLGESNGYYSESVYFGRTHKPLSP